MSAGSTVALRVFVKGDAEEHVEVLVNSGTSLSRLRGQLEAHKDLRKRLNAAYPRGNWALLSANSEPLSLSEIGHNASVLCGVATEPLKAPLNTIVKITPHSNVMTDSARNFHSAGGKSPERLLFCEFIDNSIEALVRRREAEGPPASGAVPRPEDLIEIILVYGSTRGAPNDLQVGMCPHSSHNSHTALPHAPPTLSTRSPYRARSTSWCSTTAPA